MSVPAASPDMVAKALTSAAQEVVIDLEDAVAPERKAEAREVIRDLRSDMASPRIAVRINQLRSKWGLRDLEAVVESQAQIDSIVLPKTESREDLAVIEQLLDGFAAEQRRAVPIYIQALIETAKGLTGLSDIVSRPERLQSVIIGYADLAGTLGRLLESDAVTWLPVQTQVLVCARAANIDVVDGPHLGIDDDVTFRHQVNRAVDLGFDAKWVIHPRQIAHVNSAFSPSEEAVSHAQRVVDALENAHSSGTGALSLDGELIDEAIAVAARRTLAKAGRL